MESLNLFLLVPVVIVALMVVFLTMWVISLRRVVPTNMVHIVQSTKFSTAYGRGKEAGNTYYEWPSHLPVIGVMVTTFPESIFEVKLESYEAYDATRLPFNVDITAFFRVDEAETAAQRVENFDELNGQLRSVLQGAVRRILATNKLEEVMQERASLGQQFTDEVQAQIKEWGVLPVKTIEFMDIRDTKGSEVISNIMAKEKSRIDMESRAVVATNKQIAELAEIDAQRTIDVQEQDALQQVGLRTATRDQTVGIANELAKQEIQLSAKTTAERQMDVVQVEQVRAAEIHKQVAEVNAEQDKKVRVVAAEADKQVTIVTAEATRESTRTVAEGNLYEAQQSAIGIQAEGEARAAAEKAMLLAPVDTQITLAKEIGENVGYQTYLITIEQIKAGQAVGIEMAQAMKGADLKVIANSGDIQSGVSSIGDMFSAKGGTNLTGMLTALAQSPEGKALVGKITGAKPESSVA